MIKFYYTSKRGFDEIQTRTDLSLGGYKSANPVPNNSLNNLFGDVSLYGIQKGQDEFIAVIAKNESETDTIENIKLWFDYPELYQRTLSVAAVDLDSNNRMEDIENAFQQPYFADFYEANGEENAVELGELAPQEMIGLWFKSTLNIENIVSQYSDENLIANGNPVESDESISVSVEWDIQVPIPEP
jgi:hypothetical protein